MGTVLAVIALGLGASQMPYLGDWIRQGVFSILAGVTVVAAAAAVSFRKPVYCAIWFGQTLLGVAGLFLLDRGPIPGRGHHRGVCGRDFGNFLVRANAGNQEGKTIYDRVSWEAQISAATGMVIVGVLSMTIGSVFLRRARARRRIVRPMIPSQPGTVGSKACFLHIMSPVSGWNFSAGI